MVASSRTASATPKPMVLIDVTPLVTNAAKTTARIMAAAVMIRAERCKPIATDSTFDFPARCSSRMRDVKNYRLNRQDNRAGKDKDENKNAQDNPTKCPRQCS
jgi:hypothetical protein